MSQANVEIVPRMYDAWNRRDEEEMLALSDPEVEFVNSPTAVEPGTRRGTNEVLAAARMQWEILLDGRHETDRSTIAGRRSLSWAAFLVGCRKATPGSRIECPLRGRSAMGKSCGRRCSALAGPRLTKSSKPPGLGSRPAGV
jgi:ketosteroid isomerase-like protein